MLNTNSNILFENNIKPGIWSILLVLFLFQSCASVKDLEADQFILKKQRIEFKSPDKVKNKSALLLDLAGLIKQDPINQSIWNPRTWFTKRDLVIYDEGLTKESAELMQNFLRNKKGFYHSEVSFLTTADRRHVEVLYVINTGIRYSVKSIQYTGQDKRVLQIVKDISDRSFVEIGDPLDATEFEKEKGRIINYLQNLGYANFIANYIDLKGDSTNYQVDITFDILSPPNDSIHTKFLIGDVNIFTEHLVSTAPEYALVDSLNQQNFFTKSQDYIVNPSTLSNAIYLNKGEVYQKNLRLKTVRSLSNLSTYRYVYVNPRIDTLQDSIINFDIFLTPHKNKWVIDLGSDLFYSTISQIGRQLFGVSGNISLQDRNFFGGSERYSLNMESTLEFNIRDFSANTVSSGVENALELPRYVDLFGFTKLLKKMGVISDNRYKDLTEESSTNLRLGYNFSKIIDFYTLNSFNASWGYDYRPNSRKRYIIRQLGVNVFTPKIDSLFATILNANPLLEKSFIDNISTGYLFRDFSFLYQSNKSRTGISYGVLTNFEVSGLETWTANKLVNAFSASDKTWKLGSVNFSKYIKTELDFRLYKDLTQNSTFAIRANLGVAVPFGGDDVVPYPVQFFVGGPNSIRAWQIRELGPGGNSLNILNPIPDQPFFQSGDVKLEFNFEYRTTLFWYLEGALFIDAGNVWTLRADDAFPNSHFTTGFLDQMAVGFGYGIRWDFTYFLIRLDFGYKLRNPFTDPETGRQYALTKKYNSVLGNVNVAVNYPF